jgi:hypothetical protein
VASGRFRNLDKIDWEKVMLRMDIDHGNKKGVIITARVHPGEP